MAVADMCNVILYITFTKDPYTLQLYYRYCSLMIKADSGRKAITEAELADVCISHNTACGCFCQQIFIDNRLNCVLLTPHTLEA